MKYSYKVEVLESKGIRIKGDDVSEQIARALQANSNSNARQGWRIQSVIPSLSSEGALLKCLVVYEKTT